MIRTLIATFAVTGFMLQGSVVLASAEFKIVTAFERGTYIEIGRNLSNLVAPQADIALEVMPSARSGENVRRLRYEHRVKLTIVQSDVFQAFLDTDKSVDVVAVNAGQPAKLLVDMKPEARKLIKLLKFDPNQPASQDALRPTPRPLCEPAPTPTC